ncbi:MAG: hypothetical protein A2474_07610, partial [Elusimicrobia bacterium RIFOXYC2_FULL_34_12]
PTSIYYVDPGGSDSSGTGSITSPWKTLAYAVSHVPVGQGCTVHLNAGTYNETQTSLVPAGVNVEGAGMSSTIIKGSLSSDWSYLIKADNYPAVNGNQTFSHFTVDGNNRTLETGMRVSGRHNVTIHDVAFREIDHNGLTVHSGQFSETKQRPSPSTYITGLHIYNCTFTNCSQDCPAGTYGHPNNWNSGVLHIGHLQGGLIHDIVINENEGFGIKSTDMLAGGSYLRGVKIYNCQINVPRTDPYWEGDASIELWGMSNNCEIYNCTVNNWFSLVGGNKGSGQYSVKVYDNRLIAPSGGSSQEAMEVCANDMVIIDNYIEGFSTAFGMWAFANHQNINIYNNIIYKCSWGGVYICPESTTVTNINIYNNVFDLSNNSNPVIVLAGNTNASDVKIRNNIFIGNGSNRDIQYNDGAGHMYSSYFTNNCRYNVVQGNYISSDITVQNNITSNPQINATGNRWDTYYKLKSGSPCIDTGINVGLPYNGNAPDMGRWETGTVADITAPATINTLTTNNITTNTITLNWTSVGDDGTTGTAGSYDIRYATYNITSSNFSNITQCTGEPVPKANGNSETFTISNLSANTTYYFGIKVCDEIPNWSGLSNVASGKTQTNIVNDLIGEWHFDEVSGTTASDTSDNNNNGTLVNGPIWVSGQVNNALQLDGTNDYVSVSNSSSLNMTSEMTIMFWQNRSAYTSVHQYPIHRVVPGSSGWTIIEWNTLPDTKFQFYNESGQYDGNTVTLYPTLGEWNHICYTISNGTVKGYLNGALMGTSTNITGNISNSNIALIIGTLGSGCFKGMLDEMKLYGRALSASEVLAEYNAGIPDTTSPDTINDFAMNSQTMNSVTLNWTSVGDDGTTGTASSYDIRYATYNITTSNWNTVTQCNGEPTPKTIGNSETFTVNNLSEDTTYYFAIKTADEVPNWSNISNIVFGKTTSGLVGNWRFEENAGTTASDSSGNNNSGTLTNSPQWVTGITGNALQFNGGNYVSIADSSSLNPVTALTMEAWFKKTEDVSYQRVLGKSNYPNWDYAIFFGNTGSLQACIGIGGSLKYSTITPALSVGTWYHVAVTYEGTAIRLYINGELQGTTSASGNIDNHGTTLCIGKDGGSGGNNFSGIIDEVKIYNRALTASEVLAEYNSAIPDATTPSTINNLTTSDITTTSITLNWTAVGDDGTTGTATSYDIRYYTATITTNNWSNTTQITNEATPRTSGSNESLTITGLTSDTTYYFGLKVADEVPNYSVISNIASGKTQLVVVVDSTAPATIGTL